MSWQGVNCMELCCVLPDSRNTVRDTFNIETGACFSDCLASVCCFPCATCQMKAELRARGVFGESGLSKFKQNRTSTITDQLEMSPILWRRRLALIRCLEWRIDSHDWYVSAYCSYCRNVCNTCVLYRWCTDDADERSCPNADGIRGTEFMSHAFSNSSRQRNRKWAIHY